MKTIKTLKSLTMALCTAALFALGAAKQAEDITALQGSWSGTHSAEGGQTKCTLTFKDATIEYRGEDANDWCKATFTLDEGKSPKQLLAKITEAGKQEAVGLTVRAIYQIKDDSLTIAANPGSPDVPSSFNDPDIGKVVMKKTPPPAKP